MRKMKIVLQDFCINYNSFSVNTFMQYLQSLSSLMSDELLLAFFESEVYLSYQRLREVATMEDLEFI